MSRAIAALVAAALASSVAAGAAQPVEDRLSQLDEYRLAAKAFRGAAERVRPSVVTIETFGGVTAPPVTAGGERPGRGRRGRAGRIGSIARKMAGGPTTGLVISPDGYIVTSTFNLLREPPIITVVLADGTRHVAELLGKDEIRGLCVLKINDVEDLPVPEFVGRDDLRVGQWAVAMGFGFGGDAPALSAGILSALERLGGKAIQTDANLSPANYGGPLVDIEGRVIGICSPLAPGGRGAVAGVQWYDSGIGFATPLAGAEDLLERLKAGEHIQPGRIGFRPGRAEKGVKVEQVNEGSPAEKAGLKKGDVVVGFEGKPVKNVGDLRKLLAEHVAGDKVKLTVKRGDEEVTLDVTLGGGDSNLPPVPDPFGNRPGKPEKKDDR